MRHNTSHDKTANIEAVIALIPTGRVASYGQVADLAGVPGRARWVGKVLQQTTNIVPWHRVVAASGTLSLPPHSVAYREQCLRLQREGVVVCNGRINMKYWKWQPDLAELLFILSF